MFFNEECVSAMARQLHPSAKASSIGTNSARNMDGENAGETKA